MLCENCLIERTDNSEGIPGKTENGFFGLSLPWNFTISASFGQCFSTHCSILRDNQVGFRDDRNPFFLFFLILWKFVYRYSSTTGSIVSFTKRYTTLKNHLSLCNSLFSAKIKYCLQYSFRSFCTVYCNYRMLREVQPCYTSIYNLHCSFQ